MCIRDRANCDDFFGQNGQQYFGRLVILRGVTCRYGTVGSNIYPAWMYTDIRPVMNKVWYRWAFSNDGTNLYGSVLFTYDSTLPSTTNKKGVYTVRTSGYSRFAQYPVVRDGAKGDIMAIFGIYSKDWTYNYGAYQCTVNYFDDIMFDKDAFLTEAEVEHLFRIINMLKERGCGIIYISHKMDEIKRISDEVTIMRDGQWISTDKTENLSTDDIIKRMVNREMTNRFPAKDNVPGEVLMEVSHLTGRYMPTCQDVSFQLRAGEVLGVAGLVGSRRTELLSTIFGIMSRESGEITLKGKPIANKTPRQSIKNGFAMLTEERRATGIFPYANILFNTVISNLGSYKKGPLLSDKKMASDTDWSISSMHIKTPSQKTLIKNLSGGNQQKVILGRWLLTQPDVLLLDEPTRGIDVGAKYEIYELILQLAKQGKAVMMVSSEMPELIGICDRILVMSNGRMAGILERGKDFGGVENEQETIMRLAAQYV